MAPTLASSWRSFWHELTSNDRHAGPDAPYRSGQHHPLSQSNRTPLTHSSANGAFDSHNDLDHDLESGHGGFVSHTAGNAHRGSIGSGTASPRDRGSISRTNTGMDNKMENIGTGEIQMQSFNDGLPPPPPVNHSWRRVDRWMEDHYEELFENLGPGATINDINELEHELDCTLPQDVRESLQIHDGQERGGLPTGAIFSCMLLDCEEIIQEWQNWRTVNEAYFTENRTYEIPQAPLKAFAGTSAAAIPVAQAQSSGNSSQWRAELLDKQDSQPPNAIQKVYAHPAWIPLARDWGGNNIAVDLAPGPAGKWGQIILMGRDYDCKYVIARSWAAFVATLADDLESGTAWIEEDSKELKLRAFRQPGVEPAYIDILRWRADQKYGRRAPKPRRRPLRVNSNVSSGANSPTAGFSPYASPTADAVDRGRSPHRFSTGNGKGPAASSPRAHVGSPLARVTEESAAVTSPTHSVGEKIMSSLGSPPPSSSVNAPVRSTERLISVGSTDSLPTANAPATTSTHAEEPSLLDRRGSLPMPRSRLGSTVMSPEPEEGAADKNGAAESDTAEKHSSVELGSSGLSNGDSKTGLTGLKEVEI